MKILYAPCHYYFDDQWGSEVSWAINLADNFAKKYSGSKVITGKIISPRDYRLISLLPHHNHPSMGLFDAVKFNFLYTFSTITSSFSEKFDILHHVMPFKIGVTFNFYILFKFSKLFKQKTIIGPLQTALEVTDTDLFSGSLFSSYFFRFFASLLNYLSISTLKSADTVIAISDQVKKKLIELKISEKKIVVIPPGIRSDIFLPIKKHDTNQVTFITVGHLLNRKNTSTLIKYLVRLHQNKRLNFRLMIVGTGPQEQALKSQVHQLKAESYIQFLGAIKNDHLSHIYHLADVFVSLSLAESWGQSMIEAMSCGLPVLASRTSGSREIISPAWGFLVNLENETEFRQMVTRLIQDKNLRIRMGINARKQVEKRYDWSSIYLQYEKIYKQLSSPVA